MLADLSRTLDAQFEGIGVVLDPDTKRYHLGSTMLRGSVVVPTGRFGLEQRTRYAEAVRRCCAELSAFLGYSDPSERAT